MGVELSYAVFDKLRHVRQADIVSNKRLGTVLQMIKKEQEKRDEKRSQRRPTRSRIGKPRL